MSDQAIAERVELDKKDKSELQAIVAALGGRASSRMKKADLIDSILELSGVTAARGSEPVEDAEAEAAPTEPAVAEESAVEQPDAPAEGSSENPPEPAAEQPSSEPTKSSSAPPERNSDPSSTPTPNKSQRGEDANSGRGRSRRPKNRNDEPPAEWETELTSPGDGGSATAKGSQPESNRKNDKKENDKKDQSKNGRSGNDGSKSGSGSNQDSGEDVDPGNRKRRRRGRGRDRDDNVEPANAEPVKVSGILDLRDDGYGFLRVAGLLPSREDVYVPVKMVRQFGLRKGDLVAGLARPANRNERNPALQSLDAINDRPAGEVKDRPDFDSLTALFPDERLRLERTRQPLDLTPRIIDLIAPIGKGQRGLIVSPPKAGKTSIMKEIAASIEHNNPEVELVVLLIDERPEEVTDMARHLERGEVVASTFDRPTDEHCAVAELALERAKRVVEEGRDVVILLDGITRLARAYNMSASGAGRTLSGGVDAGALYPPKKFFGAARNLEEGGSLTILASALVETGSRMDEVIFEEFKGTGNMELRLDRALAERYVFPAIDALGSSTRRSELLMDGPEQHASDKLRKVLAGLSGTGDGSAAAAMDLLMDRLRTFSTNQEFLAEIAKSR